MRIVIEALHNAEHMLANVSTRWHTEVALKRGFDVAPKDLKVLRMLMDSPSGLYGSQIVAESNGFVSRGTVYTLLARLVDKGFVREVEEPPTAALQMARTRHLITGIGKRAVMDYVREMNLVIPAAAATCVGG